MGARQRRKQIKSPLSQTQIDRMWLDPAVPLASVSGHSNRNNLLKTLVKPNMRVLEIGSRLVTTNSPSYLRQLCKENGSEYLGIDILEGPNVDVVGDAHQLACHVNIGYDLIYSSAVFEHLAMPWVVAEEISKVLNLGGFVMIETHFSWKSHERPWHFFQFSDMALRVLFSSELGFECIDCGASNPLVGRFSMLADEYLRFRPVPKIYCHSSFFGRLTKRVPNFDWRQASVYGIVGGTTYPKKNEP